MFFVSWKLSAPASPRPPRGRPRNEPPRPWAASSTSFISLVSCQGAQAIHVGGDPRIVDRHQHPGAIGQASRPRRAGSRPRRFGIDVGEDRPARPDAQSGVGRGDEGEARHDHLVARADARAPAEPARERGCTRSSEARARPSASRRGAARLCWPKGPSPADPSPQGFLKSLELSLLEPRLGERVCGPSLWLLVALRICRTERVMLALHRNGAPATVPVSVVRGREEQLGT